MFENFFNKKNQPRTSLPQGKKSTRLPISKTVITIDVFTVEPDYVRNLWNEWNDLISELSSLNIVNNINLYNNLYYNQNQWILQIEWKSDQELNQALSDPDFKAFRDFLKQWNIAISQQEQKYVPQTYRRFPGFNFDQTISKHQRPWKISTNFIIIIAFVFGIAAALIILVLR